MANPSSIDLTTYDPMDPEIQQCPFDHYAALRQQGPVFYHEASGMFFASRFDIVNQILRDTTTFSSKRSNAKTVASDEVMAQIAEILERGAPRAETLLTVDPPRQTRYRKLVSRTFSARRIAMMEDSIREIAIELIEAFPDSGPIDFHHDFAVALPVRVIHRALNMAPEVESEVKRWSDDINIALGAAPTDQRRIEAAETQMEAQAYWQAEYEDRLQNPIDDILSNLAHADFADPDLADGETRKLNFSEVYSIIRQLMVAGNETTTKFLNETMRLLIENPQRWTELERDPEGSVLGLVEEGLRLSSPTQGLFRTVTADTELGGVAIPEGATVWVMFAAANRDDGVFAAADDFNPTRENVREHLAFGKGHHFCIGAPLSRLEGRVAFEELVKRIKLPAFSPHNTFEYEPSYILRGLARLDLDIEKR